MCRSMPWAGVGAGNMKEWRWAGAPGFGMGADLFKPDFSDEEIARPRASERGCALKPRLKPCAN